MLPAAFGDETAQLRGFIYLCSPVRRRFAICQPQDEGHLPQAELLRGTLPIEQDVGCGPARGHTQRFELGKVS